MVQQNKSFLKVGSRVYIHTTKEKGKIKKIVDDKDALIEIITAKNDETGERTTKLNWHSLSNISPYREKRKPQRQKDKVYWAKVKPNAIIPTKRKEDGCYDIYSCTDKEEIVINPHEIVEIPTGIASAFSDKYRLDFQRERGSTGSIGLVPRCGQIDSGFRGEIFLKMQNTTYKTIVISSKVKDKVEDQYSVTYPMSKAICQGALEIVPDVEEEEISYDELVKIPSQRGTRKLGSSGK